MISSKVFVPILIGVACIIAVLVGTNLAVDGGSTMVYTVLIGSAVLLLVFAREYWWLAMFVGAAFGGYAYFGFKVYAHESILAVSLAGLIPSIALNPRSDVIEHRPKLPWFFYIFGLYLLVHIALSIWWNNPRGMIEYGNIGRAYLYGLWPLLFIFFFRWYGRTDNFKLAIYLLQITYFIRAIIVLMTAIYPKAMVLPGINFLLPGTAMNSGFDDLRWSGFGVCITAAAILLGSPTLANRGWQAFLLVFSFFALLMSGGRVMLVSAFLVLLTALAANRSWKTLGLLTSGLMAFIIFLNLFPETLYSFDRRSQRAISILVIGYKHTDAYIHVEGSDLWHNRLNKIGYDRWIESPKAFLIGTGIHPWVQTTLRETNWDLKFEAMLEGAADTGSYESALWSITAVTGIIGFLLCVATVLYFAFYNLKQLWRRRLTGFTLTAAFIGTFLPLHWLLFSPRMGGYPGLELLMAAVTFYYFYDQEAKGSVMAAEETEESSIYSEEVHA